MYDAEDGNYAEPNSLLGSPIQGNVNVKGSYINLFNPANLVKEGLHMLSSEFSPQTYPPIY
jgi:hypothetical protein